MRYMKLAHFSAYTVRKCGFYGFRKLFKNIMSAKMQLLVLPHALAVHFLHE